MEQTNENVTLCWKKMLAIALLFVFISVLFSAVNPQTASADAFDKIDVNGQKVITETELEDTLFSQANTFLIIILGFGGFWVVASVIFAGMKLSAAQGNPQARTAGFIGLAMALFGAFVVYKALEITGWVASLGG